MKFIASNRSKRLLRSSLRQIRPQLSEPICLQLVLLSVALFIRISLRFSLLVAAFLTKKRLRVANDTLSIIISGNASLKCVKPRLTLLFASSIMAQHCTALAVLKERVLTRWKCLTPLNDSPKVSATGKSLKWLCLVLSSMWELIIFLAHLKFFCSVATQNLLSMKFSSTRPT